MADNDPAKPDPAAARFWMLQLMRLGGVLLVVGALLIISGRIPGPEVLGYGLLILGMVEFFVMPMLLARRWKTPDE